MNDGTLSHSSDPDRLFEVSDERLAAELKRQGGASANYPVGELLDRHWEAVFSYARLCTGGVRPAGMLTTASFTRLFGDSLHQSGPSAAWRPQLLVTVRRMAAEWLVDQRRELLDPDLLTEAGGEGGQDRAAARLLPPENRRLISRAFQRLPEPSRCLLWHGEVEAEHPEVPAALLGISPEDAVTELERARERLRQGCLEIHHELAPSQECRRYHRMLDVSFRRGGIDLDPDLRAHMDECGHCRYAADQLSRFNGELAVPLAEAVLGWGARAYVASRWERAAAALESRGDRTGPAFGGGPADTVGEALMDGAAGAGAGPAFTGRGGGAPFGTGAGPAAGTPGIVEFRPDADDARPPGLPPRTAPDGFPHPGTPSTAHEATAPQPVVPSGQDAPAPGGDDRPSRRRAAPRNGTGTRASRRATGRKASRRAPGRRDVALAVLTVSALITVPLLLWAADADSDGRHDTADGGHSSATPSRGTNPSWTRTGEKKDGAVRGRLHNTATGLCVGFAEAKPVAGAEARLVPCSSESAAQWSYATDGLLRDADHPSLCLDSHLGYSVRLAPCAGPSKPAAENARYDFTLQGVLVPRWNQDLALAPAAAEGESALVLKLREDGPVQHWTFDTSSPSLQLEVVNWDSTKGDARGSTTGKPSAPATAPAGPRTPTATAATPGHGTPSAEPSGGSCSSTSVLCSGDGSGGSVRDGEYGTGSGSGGHGSFGGGGWGGRR
ncbi:ricin-type beta-trefoil lectin domain protein [Streptomyces populi]|uniref:ricin-type beta-trefoil lectin domain protein n=1 Tax=Streptomyces populi TaxID=2058924 RepID=UPI001F0CA324|nr:ricin-type beta-trefoil lectin domain protein [Streptomyces populi]